MPTPRWPTRVSRVLLAGVVVSAAGWYSPFFTAAMWHGFHPRGWISYRGLSIYVPWPWIPEGEPSDTEAGVDPEGVSLKRLPFSMDRRLSGQAIFVTVISADPGVSGQQQAAGWIGAFRAAHPGSTFAAQTPVAVPADASCLSARSPGQPGEVVWTCISVAGGWVSDFEGQTADEPIYFRLVSQLRNRR